MRNPTVDELFMSACCNDQFKYDVYTADKSRVPKRPVNEKEKVIISGIYYGWLVGYYHKRWREYV